MHKNKQLLSLFTAVLLCACALPVRTTPPAEAKKDAAAPRLSPEDAQKVEQLYYQAVGAYSSNDIPAALKYLNEISVINPSYPPASELKGKIKRISEFK